MTFDWNDLRILLAVARKGSTTAAARELGTSPSTAARRVAALEEALGVVLFERSPDGYTLTEAGRAIVPAAERMEAGALEVEERLAALARGIAGNVRLTTLDTAATQWVIPVLPAFAEAHPGVNVEVLTGDEKLDLLRGEADVALRFGPRPDETGLVVRRIMTVRLALYCSRDYAEREQATAGQTAAGDLRARTFTLLYWAYDHVRKCVGFVRWHEGDADQIAPSLYAGRTRSSSEVPAAPVAPATPVRPGMPGADPFDPNAR